MPEVNQEHETKGTSLLDYLIGARPAQEEDSSEGLGVFGW